MKRREFILSLVPASLVLADSGSRTRRGILHAVDAPFLEFPTSRVLLTGDEATMGVLRDERLNHTDFEVIGTPLAMGTFDVDRIHTRSLFVHKDGKRLMVTYWCDVCYIRTYTPGKCWCCQKYTDLDLRENLDDE